jgi:putative Mg2+ transporter-C (MgtC) family protein
MNALVEELQGGVGDATALVPLFIRLSVAAVLGGLIGLNRERQRKAAGLRTHILVALGAAVFTLVPEFRGMAASDLTRVVQGVAAGIGFLGAGTILKDDREGHIHGLTTAAGIWLTAAVGMAAGAGLLWVAVVGLLLAWLTLTLLARFEHRPP